MRIIQTLQAPLTHMLSRSSIPAACLRHPHQRNHHRLQSHRSAGSDLKALIAAQQDPASPLYHQWLSPDQFAARFAWRVRFGRGGGAGSSNRVFPSIPWRRSQNAIHFRRVPGQVERAFQTEMHTYTENERRTAFCAIHGAEPARGPAPTVLGIKNLDDFRPQAHVVFNKMRVRGSPLPVPGSTHRHNETIFFASLPRYRHGLRHPTDIQLGYTGVGQSITWSASRPSW